MNRFGHKANTKSRLVRIAALAAIAIAALALSSTAGADIYGELAGSCFRTPGAAPDVQLDMPWVTHSSLAPYNAQNVIYQEWLYKYTSAGWTFTGGWARNFVTIPAGNTNYHWVFNYAQSEAESLYTSEFRPDSGGSYAILVQYSWQTTQGSPLEQRTHWATFGNNGATYCTIP